MPCEHKHIKSVNCILYCIDCGERLPDDFNKPVQLKEESKAESKPKKKKGGAKE